MTDDEIFDRIFFTFKAWGLATDCDLDYLQSLDAKSAEHFWRNCCPIERVPTGYAARDRRIGFKTNKQQQNRLRNARDSVKRNLPHCLETLDLVVKNGNDREKSIWQLMHGKKSHRRGTARRGATPANSNNSTTTSKRKAN